MAATIRQGQPYGIEIASAEGVKAVVVSIRNGGRTIERSGARVVDGNVLVQLTQEDTASMKVGPYQMQARVTHDDGSVTVSGIASGVVLVGMVR